MDLSGPSERGNSDRNYADLTGRIRLVGDEPIYDGNYSKVYRGTLDGKLVAVKVLKFIPGKNDAAMERKMEREMTLMAGQQHALIAEFMGHARGPKLGPLGALVTPWYPNGDSHTYLEARKDTLTFWDRIDLCGSVVNALQFLHKKGIVHGDIKPGNILIDRFENPRICDFGLSTLFLDSGGAGLTTTSEFTGTPRYLSPELLTSESTPPTTASDVWALGCVFLEFMFGIMPYAHRLNNNRGVIYQDIKSGRLPCEKMDRQGLDDAVQELLHICWHYDHRRRLRVQDLFHLVAMLQGSRCLYRNIWSTHLRVPMYEMVQITRHFDTTRLPGIKLFVRPTPASELLSNDGIDRAPDWREWALFQVRDDNSYGGLHWDVEEIYTYRQEVLLNPEHARILTRTVVSQEYEAMRSRGESPFPILPISEWPFHGEGSIIRLE